MHTLIEGDRFPKISEHSIGATRKTRRADIDY